MNPPPTIKIKSNYLLIVEETVEYLQQVKSYCEKILNENDEKFQELKPLFLEHMEKLCDKFEKIASGISSTDINEYKVLFRKKIHPIIMVSEIVERIYSKPLGYPGDYEMINMLMGEVDTSSSNLFVTLLDEMHRTARTAIAHRNRISMMGKRLIEEAMRVTKQERLFSVLCIGCGPAIELQQFIRGSELANNSILHVVDFNRNSVDNIQQTLSELVSIANRNTIIESTYINLTELLDSNSTRYIGNSPSYDMIYCAGLFDYIPDDLCRDIVKFSLSCLRKHGVLTVTNIHSNVPHKQYLNHALDWEFMYRDEEQMSLLTPSNISYQVTTDETGLNLFLDARILS